MSTSRTEFYGRELDLQVTFDSGDGAIESLSLYYPKLDLFLALDMSLVPPTLIETLVQWASEMIADDASNSLLDDPEGRN